MDDLSRFCCLNSDCPDHGKRGAGNLTVDQPLRPRQGPTACSAAAPARPASPSARGRPCSTPSCPPEKAVSVLEHIAEGCGVRQTGRLVREPRHRRPATAGRPATTPATSTTSWSPFPPRTREVQFDEKWAFVAKKEKNCDPDDPADDHKGDYWDHVAFDPEHRLVVGVVPGERTAENVEAVVEDFQRRTGGRLMDLITSDDYPAYEAAILDAYGETVTPPRTGKRGRARKAPYKVAAAGPDLRDGREDAGEGPGGRGRHAGGLRDDGGGAGGAGDVEGQPGDQHVVRGAAERDGPAPQRAEGPEDATASRRTGGITRRSPTSRCTATTSAGRCGRCGSRTSEGRWQTADPGDGGGVGRSRLVDGRMVARSRPCDAVRPRGDARTGEKSGGELARS